MTGEHVLETGLWQIPPEGAACRSLITIFCTARLTLCTLGFVQRGWWAPSCTERSIELAEGIKLCLPPTSYSTNNYSSKIPSSKSFWMEGGKKQANKSLPITIPNSPLWSKLLCPECSHTTKISLVLQMVTEREVLSHVLNIHCWVLAGIPEEWTLIQAKVHQPCKAIPKQHTRIFRLDFLSQSDYS